MTMGSGASGLVLEPLDGRSLTDVIGHEGALPVERALRLAFEVADGLQAAHNLVLVHGALAAEHVLVGADDTVKLMGFEVARLGRAGPRYGTTAPPPVTSVIQPVPARQSPPAPAPPVPEPAAVERPAEVVIRPPVAPPVPPLPRTEPIPPAQPVVKSTPPVTGEGAPPTLRATSPVPAPPATRTPATRDA
jgi:serine/threonine protein kinase